MPICGTMPPINSVFQLREFAELLRAAPPLPPLLSVVQSWHSCSWPFSTCVTHVLVGLGCYNRALQLGAYKQQAFIPMVLEVGSPRSTCQQTRCLVKDCFLVHAWCLLAVASYDGRGKEALWAEFSRGTANRMCTCVQEEIWMKNWLGIMDYGKSKISGWASRLQTQGSRWSSLSLKACGAGFPPAQGGLCSLQAFS